MKGKRRRGLVEVCMILFINTRQHQPTIRHPATEYMEYIVTNISLLPVGVANELNELDTQWMEGDLTRRGYLKRRSLILDEYPHLRVANGSVVFRERAGQMGGATRKLLTIHEEEEDETNKVPVKSLKDDIIRSISDWEHRYGPWVSGWSQSNNNDVIMTSYVRILTTKDGRGGDYLGKD